MLTSNHTISYFINFFTLLFEFHFLPLLYTYVTSSSVLSATSCTYDHMKKIEITKREHHRFSSPHLPIYHIRTHTIHLIARGELLYQQLPTPRIQTDTGPWSVRSWTSQQELSDRRDSAASSAFTAALQH